MSTLLGQRYRRNPKIEESPLQGELMLFDPDKGRFFVLNQTMAYLWQQCDGGKAIDGIVESVPDGFSEADPEIVAHDMQSAVEELVSLGLIAPT